MKKFPTPKPNEPSKRAEAFAAAVQNLVGQLYERWLDEKEHEDITTYQLPFNKYCGEYGVEILKMTKRPFGFQFKADGRTYKMFCNGRHVGYQRI